MRKAGGIRATLVLVNKVADSISEDEGKRWRESTEIKPSQTSQHSLVLGVTCLWRLSVGLQKGWLRSSVLFAISSEAQHLLKENPAECLFPHLLGGLTSHVLHRGGAQHRWRCLKQPHSTPSSRACSIIHHRQPRDLDSTDTWATGELESTLAITGAGLPTYPANGQVTGL